MSFDPQPWTETDLVTMSDRLDTLLAASDPRISSKPHEELASSSISTAEAELPRGWKLLDPVRDGWRPTPIGVSCFA